MKRQMKKAFTLIELLVVITIIGILAVGGAAVFTTQIQKARDSTRITDMTALRTAIVQYDSDNNQYPPASKDKPATGSEKGFEIKSYMQSIPKDPKTGTQVGAGSGALDYTYGVGMASVPFDTFELSATMENDGNISKYSKGDQGDDDMRYELYASSTGTGGTVSTKASKNLSTVTSWVQTGTFTPSTNGCINNDGNNGTAITCTSAGTGDEPVLVIR